MEQLIGAAQRTRNGSEMASRAWLKRRGRGRTIPEIPEAEPLVKSLEGSQTLTVRHPYVDGRPLEDGLPRLRRLLDQASTCTIGDPTISVREFDMPQEFEIPDFLPQYWHWLSGIFF